VEKYEDRRTELLLAFIGGNIRRACYIHLRLRLFAQRQLRGI
jgi:hypothetical protein